MILSLCGQALLIAKEMCVEENTSGVGDAEHSSNHSNQWRKVTFFL